jgi:putative aldouronate transport system substrate-binding protein
MVLQKASSGLVAAVGGGQEAEANSLFKQDEGENTDKQFYMFKVVAPGIDPDKTTFSPRSSLGWDAIGITTKNKYPVETVKFANYLASEEGQYLLLWGIEGVHWDMVNGRHQPRPEIIPGFQKDWNEYSKATGIRKWTWFINNGYGSDGTPFDLVTKYERDAVAAHALTSMANSVYDTSIFDDLGPLGGTPEALVEQKLSDIVNKAFSALISAKTTGELEREYQKMLAELEANNTASIERIYTENYQKRAALQN